MLFCLRIDMVKPRQTSAFAMSTQCLLAWWDEDHYLFRLLSFDPTMLGNSSFSKLMKACAMYPPTQCLQIRDEERIDASSCLSAQKGRWMPYVGDSCNSTWPKIFSSCWLAVFWMSIIHFWWYPQFLLADELCLVPSVHCMIFRLWHEEIQLRVISLKTNSTRASILQLNRSTAQCQPYRMPHSWFRDNLATDQRAATFASNPPSCLQVR